MRTERETAPPGNLPLELTTFVGRDRELVEVRGLLRRTRLVTLTGAGGSGKTRLAIRVSREVLADHPDGAWFVDLAPLTDPGLVPNAVATVVDVREAPMQPLLVTLQQELADRRLLILLDNCEHVIAAAAETAESLLRAGTGVRILVTSREPLAVPGEVTWRVPSLSLPEGDDVAGLHASQAARLFIERARDANPAFELAPGDVPAVAGICRRLDGIPLAIELAAARVRALTPRQIEQGLRDRFRLLTAGARTAIPRQRTLEASVEWSHRLLDEAQRRLMARLAVFAGGFTLDAAQEVCSGNGIDRADVAALLSDLVDRSLLQAERGSAGPRYRLLETIRDYAARRLAASKEEGRVRDRHLSFYAAFVGRVEPELEGGEVLRSLRGLEVEIDNIRTAAEWSAVSGRSDDRLRIVASFGMSIFWAVRGHLREGRGRVEAALADPEADPLLRATALIVSSGVSLFLADLRAARAAAERALSLAEEIGDARTVARATMALGWSEIWVEPVRAREVLERGVEAAREAADAYALALSLSGVGYAEVAFGRASAGRPALEESLAVARRHGNLLAVELSTAWLGLASAFGGEFEEARALAQEALSIARGLDDRFFLPYPLALLGLVLAYLGDFPAAEAALGESVSTARRANNPFQTAVALVYLGQVQYARGNPDAAMERLEEGVPFVRSMGMRWLLSAYLPSLGEAALERGDRAAARAYLQEAVGVASEVGDPYGEGRARHALSKLERQEGETEAAEALEREALRSFWRAGIKPGTAEVLEGLAELAAAQESFVEAARLLGAAERLREQIGYRRFPVDVPRYEAAAASARERLGEDRFEAARTEGRGMSAEEAVRYVSRARGERRRPSAGWASLTPTEVDVVRLVAEGLTNPQIGERLFISKRTVQAHLSHVFAKLDIASRAELAAEAARRGIRASGPRE